MLLWCPYNMRVLLLNHSHQPAGHFAPWYLSYLKLLLPVFRSSAANGRTVLIGVEHYQLKLTSARSGSLSGLMCSLIRSAYS